MPNFSLYKENEVKNMDEILKKITTYKDWLEPYVDPLTHEELHFNLEKVFNENLSINLNNTDIKYNIVDYNYEKSRYGQESNDMRSQRIQSVTGSIIVFSDGISTQFIYDRYSSANSLAFLRKINDYKGKGEIENYPLMVNEDFFIWMIDKVINHKDISIDEDKHFGINKIIGFKGSTDDQLAEVSGKGNRIMNIISTLAFLFETETVTHISPRIEYESNVIEITFDLRGNLNIDIDTYTGDYMITEPKEKYAKIVLMTYLKLLPLLMSGYKNDLENELWSPKKKIDFINDLGNGISEKIKEKISNVEE